MNPISKKDSQAIVVIRYPLIVLVVMIHCFYGELNNDFYQLPGFRLLTHDLLPIITVAAVPTFFLISGYLFFKGRDFSKSTYIGKMKRRVGTLLIPYLVWNLIIIAALFLVQLAKPDFQPLTRKAIADFNITDFLACFYNMRYINPLNASGPIDTPLWFLQNLMFFSIITPVIYFFVKRKRVGAVYLLVVAIIGFMELIPENNFCQNDNLLYFSLGAYISLHCSSIDSLCSGRKVLAHIAVFIITLIIAKGVSNIQLVVHIATVINIISLTFIFFAIAERFRNLAEKNIVKTFSKSTFFVYCYHTLGAGVVFVIVKRGILQPTSDGISIVFFFFAVIVISLFGTALYCLKERLKRLA